MNNQLKPASEAKYSSRTSTLAHETRKNKQRLAVLLVVIAVYIFSAADVLAQQTKGDIAVGAHLSIGTAGPGFGGNLRFNATDHVRLEGLFTIFASNTFDIEINGEKIQEDTKWWNAIVNMHYVFSNDTQKKFVPYMIAGLGFLGKGSGEDAGGLPVINIGAGADLKVVSNFALNFELKLRAVAPVTIGAVYTF